MALLIVSTWRMLPLAGLDVHVDRAKGQPTYTTGQSHRRRGQCQT
jgi:hypothetical protein